MSHILIAMPVNNDLHPALKRSGRAIADAVPTANPDHTFDLAWFPNGGGGHTGYDQQRYATIADARNALLDQYLDENHDYVLWIDADIVRIDLDFPTVAIAENPDGVTGLIVFWNKHRPHFYDVGGYVQNGEWAATMPPYWKAPGFPLTDLDSVGCVYLIPAAVYRSGARYCATEGYTEHYAVCQHARAEGRRVGCLVTHTAAHAYLDEYQMIAWPPLRPTYSMTGNGTVRGSSYTFPLVDNGDCWPHWRYHTETETLDWLRQHVASDWNCVDVGAHVGMYTAWLADHCAHVVAVEPHRPAVQMLIDTLRYNNLHARIVPKAIAAEPGQKAANLCLAGDLESTAGEWTFTTIDEVCADMARVDLVKIDVDGYDYAALQGAQQTIQQHRPAIIVECRDKSLTLFGASVADIAAYLKECGYTWHVADERNWIAVCSDA